MKQLLLLLSGISLAYSAVHNVTCPHAADIAPCKCYNETAQIWCTGQDFNDEKLRTIGPKVKTDYGLFHLLFINHTNIGIMPKNAFNEVAFERIFIEENQNLTHIDAEAFSNTNLTDLVIQNNTILDSPDIFNLSRNFPHIQSIELNGNGIKYIPEYAFLGDSNKIMLQYLWLTNNSIAKIGKNAFLGNPRLTRLGLDNNDLRFIDDYALNISSAVTLGHRLTIYMTNNKLASHSFTKNSIILPRNVYATFHFENNAFNDLSEDVFKPLTTEGHKFVFSGNKFFCDCRMRWILDEPHSNNIYNVNCVNHDNRSLFNLTVQDLEC